MKFFLAVLFMYLFFGLLNRDVFLEALLNFFTMTLRIVPLLLLVFIFSIFINLFLSKERIKKIFGKKIGFKAYLYAIISGILISGPPYVLYPLLGELKKKGMKNSLLAVFLYNRNVKIPFLPVLIFYFGLKYSFFLSFYIIIFSIISGFLINVLVKDEKEGF